MRPPATPPLIARLVAEGRWPADEAQARAQYLQSRAPAERIKLLAAEESWLDLNRPPFRTVRDYAAKNPFWTWPTSDPSGIDFDLAVVIGDFGLGSDAPIVLDYRSSAVAPRVLRLRWTRPTTDNRWVEMAPDLETFVEVLGL